MKNLVLFFGLSLVVSETIAQKDRDTFTVGGGLNVSHIKGSGLGIGDQLGYFVQVGAFGKSTPYIGYGGDIQFQNQFNTFGEVTMDIHSLNAALYLKVYPAKELVSVSVGIQEGYVSRYKVEGENMRSYNKGSLAGLLGLSFDHGQFSSNIRGCRYFSDPSIFDTMVQLGINYHFN